MRKSTRRLGRPSAVLIAAGISLSLVVSGCSSDGGSSSASSSDGDKWVIALTSDLSGSTQLYGTSQLAGAQTYVEHINDEGGIHGREIELKVEDHTDDVQNGVTVFRQVLSEEPMMVLGPLLSSLAAVAAPLGEQAGVNTMMLVPVNELMDPPQEHLFGGSIALDQSARIQAAMIDDLSEGADDLKVVVARLDAASGEDFAKAAKAEIDKRGWEFAGDIRVALGATDVSDQAAALANSGADWCLCEVNGAPNIQLVRGVRGEGSDMGIVNYFGGGIASEVLEINDPNYYAALPFMDGAVDTEGTNTMRERAEASGHDKEIAGGYAFTQGYVLTMLVAQALEQCGEDCDADGLRETLRSGEFDTDGLTGDVALGDGPFVVRSARMVRAVDGELEVVGEWREDPGA